MDENTGFTTIGKGRVVVSMIREFLRHAGLAAALGCAISGARRLLNISYDAAADRFVQVDRASFNNPSEANRKAVRALLQRYETRENSAYKK